MTSVWRATDLQQRTVRRLSAGRRCFYAYLLHGLIGAVVMPGCAWVRAQAQHRSEECERLCSQADQAQEAGRVAQADQLLDRAMKKSPRDLEVQRQLTDSLWQVGRYRESLDLLTRLAEEHPHDRRLSMTLAERHAELEQYDAALGWLQPALKTEPVSPGALKLKATIESAQGRDDAALFTYQKLSQLDGRQAEAQLQMGRLYLQRGQPERAAPLLRSVLALPQVTNEEQLAAQWTLGQAYAQMERWSDAAVQLAAAAPHREMSSDDWHAVAYAQFRRGDLSKARAALNHALTLDPRHAASQELTSALWTADPDGSAAEGALQPAGYERLPGSGHSLPQ